MSQVRGTVGFLQILLQQLDRCLEFIDDGAKPLLQPLRFTKFIHKRIGIDYRRFGTELGGRLPHICVFAGATTNGFAGSQQGRKAAKAKQFSQQGHKGHKGIWYWELRIGSLGVSAYPEKRTLSRWLSVDLPLRPLWPCCENFYPPLWAWCAWSEILPHLYIVNRSRWRQHTGIESKARHLEQT